MDLWDLFLLIFLGLVTGGLNTLAGGGSLLTLPLLIFMGLPPLVANASNRVAILIQNIFAIKGFQSKGIFVWPHNLYYAISSSIGSLIGIGIAIEIDDLMFKRILSLVMLMVILFNFIKLHPHLNQAVQFSRLRNLIGIITFFFIGIYGGFIQAGVGYLIIAALGLIHQLNMTRINSIKVYVVLFYNVIAIIIFSYNGLVEWQYGLVLALGSGTGGWITSRWSVNKADKKIKTILNLTIIILAIRLWFYST